MSVLYELVERFAKAAVIADEASISGKGKLARKKSLEVCKLQEKIWYFGDEGKVALSRLLTHSHPSARVQAAVYLLKFQTADALAVLQDAAAHEGLVPFIAQQALKRWEEGAWDNWE